MARFTRSTVVDAPLSRVWAFHSTIDGLRALTPRWLALRVEAVRRPEAAEDTALLPAGTEITASVAPLWLFPRQYWVSVIEARAATLDECAFVDTMRDGPLPEWRHTHTFEAVGDSTRVVDEVEFEPPDVPLGGLLVRLGLAAFFAYRHRRTRTLLSNT